MHLRFGRANMLHWKSNWKNQPTHPHVKHYGCHTTTWHKVTFHSRRESEDWVGLGFTTDWCWRLFSIVNSEHKRFKCNIDQCKRDFLSGVKESNLLAHVKRKHATFFEKTIGAKYVPSVNTYSLQYRRLKYIQRCTEIVASNGNAFNILHLWFFGG